MRYLLQTLRSYPTSHVEQESNQAAHPSVIQRVLLDHRFIPFWHSCFPYLVFSLSHNFYHELSHTEVTKFAVHFIVLVI